MLEYTGKNNGQWWVVELNKCKRRDLRANQTSVYLKQGVWYVQSLQKVYLVIGCLYSVKYPCSLLYS